MTGLLFCAIALMSCAICSMANWRIGLSALVCWGYFFGILKAYFFASWGHFIFDSATIGFYLGMVLYPPPREELGKREIIYPWLVVLTLWPLFVATVPIQHYLVQLVGLRGNIFWLPMMLIGSMMDAKCRTLLAFCLAILNLITFSVAIGEFIFGVELFVPDNEVTKIVFMSKDVGEGSLRIPATFTNAHSYAGTMVQSVPWILGELLDRKRYQLGGAILIAGLISALLGIFIAGPRQPVVILGSLVAFAIFSGRGKVGFVVIALLSGLVVGFIVSQDERFQRFMMLADTENVSYRVMNSIDLSFWEVLADYPMGNGMGAGGTSLPYFVGILLEKQIVLENEYARLFLEQGFVGFVLWLGFIWWFLTRKIDRKDPANFTKNIIWLYTAIMFATAWIGIGLMSTIPGTSLLFLGIGYCVTPSVERKSYKEFGKGSMLLENSGSTNVVLPAYQRGLARS